MDTTTFELGDVTASGSYLPKDRTYSYYDANSRMIYSNENGGIWTRYFYDAQGNITKEVQFQYRNPSTGEFLNEIVSLATRPDLADLETNYLAAVAAHDIANGVDTIREITRLYDANGNLLQESTHSETYGSLTSEWHYDAYDNVVKETTAKGVTGEEQQTRYRFDNLDHLTQINFGPTTYYDSDGNPHTQIVTQMYTYDDGGNRSTQTNERGYTERYYYDDHNRLISQWDLALLNSDNNWSSTLRTDYTYDNFYRIERKSEIDLTKPVNHSERVRNIDLLYNHYDELIRITDPLLYTTQMSYDRAGNKISETNARNQTEYYNYDGDNRVVGRIDRVGERWTTAYNGMGYKILEIDGNGRRSAYSIGAYGRVQGITISGGDQTQHQGINIHAESYTLDWQGRQVAITDNYGKEINNVYDDADRLRRIHDVATDKISDFTYNISGQRTHEVLTVEGAETRNQTFSYNQQGWLTGVDSHIVYNDAGVGLNQDFHIVFQYDQLGNRVQSNDRLYGYDANNRMTSAYDDPNDQVIESMTYDGFGNRASVTTAGGTVTYSYDLNNRIVSSSAGESWNYDEVGNNTRHQKANGEYTTSEYDGENRTTHSFSHARDDSGDWANTNTYMQYDGVGNVLNTKIRANDYGFDELAYYDVRYDVQRKHIANSYVKGARYLYGDAYFSYDENGQLTYVDRGRKKGADQNTAAYFAYDNQAHIIARTEKPTASFNTSFMRGYYVNPDLSFDNDGWLSFSTLSEQTRNMVYGWGNSSSGKLELTGYVYADGHQVGEAQVNQNSSLKRLTLQGGTTITDFDGEITGVTIQLQASDIVTTAGGAIDREQTARTLAMRVYQGFDALTADAQVRVVAYVQGRLPTSDSAIVDGAIIDLYAHIDITDITTTEQNLITDYAFQTIGGDEGLPSGVTSHHTVKAGETLHSIASAYFGSPAYWYLIADANGLSGEEELKAGTTLTIPNLVANSVNDKDSYKIYSESEIIGSTSPEVRVKQKKKKWYQKLVQILIVVIIVVVAVYTGYIATELFAAYGAVAATLATVAVGYAAGVATSAVTQGLAVAVGLQEDFDWKAARDMGKSFAISSLAAGITSLAGTGNSITQVLSRGAVELGRQYLENDGKITSWTGVALAMVGTDGSTASSNWSSTVNYVNKNRRILSAGLNILEKTVRGKDVGTMDWANVAAASFSKNTGIGHYFNKSGGIQWSTVAQETLIAGGISLAVGSRLGTDQALDYFGNQLGSMAVAMMGEKRQLEKLTPEQIESIFNQKESGGFAQQQQLNEIADERNETVQASTQELADAQKESGARVYPYGSNPSDNSLDITTVRSGNAPGEVAPGLPETPATMSVNNGDTLWDIAREQLGAQASDADILQYTKQLMEVNGISDPRGLQIGRELSLATGNEIVSQGIDMAYNKSDAELRADLAARASNNSGSIDYLVLSGVDLFGSSGNDLFGLSSSPINEDSVISSGSNTDDSFLKSLSLKSIIDNTQSGLSMIGNYLDVLANDASKASLQLRRESSPTILGGLLDHTGATFASVGAGLLHSVSGVTSLGSSILELDAVVYGNIIDTLSGGEYNGGFTDLDGRTQQLTDKWIAGGQGAYDFGKKFVTDRDYRAGLGLSAGEFLVDFWNGDYEAANKVSEGAGALLFGAATEAAVASKLGGLKGSGSDWIIRSPLKSDIDVATLNGGILPKQLFDSWQVPFVRVERVTSEMANRFRGNGYLDPLTNKIISPPNNSLMSVDHIVPVDTMIKMPGFKDLTPDQMKIIIQDKYDIGNLQPLPQPLNSSKRNSMSWDTYKGQSLNQTYSNNLQELQRALSVDIQDQIDAFNLMNKAGKR
ncbi:MAG: LysM peptidoglycan-binding domain-containing protein [Candidatus Thiodiazotropha sp. 6PLUC3]